MRRPARAHLSHAAPMLALQILLLAAAAVAAGSTILSTLWLGIGPTPSSGEARKAMLAAIEAAPAGSAVDLGSGWGTLAIACAMRYPGRQVIGYELSWLPWAVSVALQRTLDLHNLSFVRRDLFDQDLTGHAAMLCYMWRSGMCRLERKLEAQATWPAVLVSNTFALPSVIPKHVFKLNDLYATPIFVYTRSVRATRHDAGH